MANRTDPSARNIRGTNPQNLIEKIVRSKIYQNTFWKDQCFGLTAATLVDKAMELDHLGGTFGGNRKPTPFICLVMKMLQIQPDKEIVVEFIKNEDYKYVRILGAFYLRLTGTDVDVYRYLEPLYNDYRKIRRQAPDGQYAMTHVDEVIDELLTKDYSCDIALPRIKKRWTLEQIGTLESRKSVLEDDFEEEEEKEENEQIENGMEDGEKDYYHGRSPTRERERGERDRRRDSHRYRDRDYDRDYDREYGRGRERDRDHRDRERDRDRDRDRDRYRVRDENDYGHDRERERDREGRERERRDRDRGRRRSRSRSKSRDRDDREAGENRKRHDHSSVSPRRRGGDENGPKKKKDKKEKKDDGTDHPNPEIAEANRLRASLGLKPLKL